MRLINVHTYRPTNNGPKNVKYGILSHRREAEYDDEVLLQDLEGPQLPVNKKGFSKITNCCEKAKSHGLDYVWVDTCCIDKKSSAELQESINSMFRWYEEAEICFAYLKGLDIDQMKADPGTFEKDEWFTRGWTLQELIAPRRMQFFDRSWRYIGDKSSLSHRLRSATGVSERLLEGSARLADFSIAQRMFWASKRATTLIEDRAYSLFGIFEINMPMLYGEGQRAFMRLQEEIIKQSDDHSIFAWRGIDMMSPGLLAPSPEAFQYGSNIKTSANQHSFSMTNRGLSITLEMQPWSPDIFVASLNCYDAFDPLYRNWLTIWLRRLDEDDQYARIAVDGQDIATLFTSPRFHPVRHGLYRPQSYGTEPRSRTVHVRQRLPPSKQIQSPEIVYGFRICKHILQRDSRGNNLFHVFGQGWDSTNRILRAKPGTFDPEVLGVIDISKQGKGIELIQLGFDFDFNPTVLLTKTVTSYIRRRNDNIKWKSDNRVMEWVAPNEMNGEWWALKQDRIHGLDATLCDAQGSMVARIELKKESCDINLCVWDLRVTKLTSSIFH